MIVTNGNHNTVQYSTETFLDEESGQTIPGSESPDLSTPLMLASLGGHPHCVHELVLAGADVSRRNINDVRQITVSIIIIPHTL